MVRKLYIYLHICYYLVEGTEFSTVMALGKKFLLSLSDRAMLERRCLLDDSHLNLMLCKRNI